ncbi:hypothetical protein ACHAXN_009845 [Cyclotella atomus]
MYGSYHVHVLGQQRHNLETLSALPRSLTESDQWSFKDTFLSSDATQVSSAINGLSFLTMMSVMFLFILRGSRHSYSFDRSVSYPIAVGIRGLSSKRHYTMQETPTIDSTSTNTSLLWLSANRLRLRDNTALTKAVELGPGGLAICVDWPYGSIPSAQQLKRDEITPVEAFGFAAVQSLDESLQELGQSLLLIPSKVDGEPSYDPVSAIADAVQDLQPRFVIVDTCLLEQHHNYASRLRDKIDANVKTNVIEVVDEEVLIDHGKLPKALGRSRNGGRILRWSTFLSNVLSREEELNDKFTWSLDKLPPPIYEFGSMIQSSPIPQIESFPEWTRQLLSDWGEVSEGEALRRANLSQTRSVESKPSYQLSEKDSKDTKLSPYLRFGMVSPQRAAQAGVRKRDLLWRDWSRVCYGLLNPLRRGEPVLEYMDKCNQFKDLDTKDEELFNMWIVGNTGSQTVDAGMRQLWHDGWMPRKVRLLCAACLVEGMGLDWRLGRDWFKHTLIDHDPAINELMWQNAGLVGVDPFYNGIAWEAAPSVEDAEYVEKWMNVKLNWPSSLNTYAARRPLTDIVLTAKSRREAFQLKGVYKAARTVSNSGVRVAWPSLVQQDNAIVPGEVLGVGMKPIIELKI